MRTLILAVTVCAVAGWLTAVQPYDANAQGLREATLAVTGMT